MAAEVIIVIGGRPYPIHPLDFAWDQVSDGAGRCLGGFQANDGVASGDYLFGDTAMRVSCIESGIDNTPSTLLQL